MTSVSLISGTIEIDGKTYKGRNLTITENDIIIDGVSQGSVQTSKPVTIVVTGSCGDIRLENGTVEVEGNAQSIQTTSGDIDCLNVKGSVVTVSGNVTCSDVIGSVHTVSGKITHNA